MASTKIKAFIMCLCVGTLVTGCVPLVRQTSPKFHGRVLDAQTMAPVSGAAVSLDKAPFRQVTTSRTGKFYLKPKYNFQLVIPGPCPIELLGKTPSCWGVIVSGAGYEAQWFDLSSTKTTYTNILLERVTN